MMNDVETRCFKCLLPVGSPAIYGLHEACFLSWFKLQEKAEFVSLVRHSADSLEPKPITQTKGFISSFFHGKFRKYSADLSGESYILKVKESKAPELPEVEYLCNQIGHALGLPVADYYLIDLFESRAFVTKNFIRHGAGISNLTHIYHYFKEGEPYSCKALIGIIQREAKRPYDVDIFIHTCLFDALIGNHDRHGRNLAFVTTPQRTALSPVYDNTSYLGLEAGEFLKANFDPRGKIYTELSKEPRMNEYVQEFIAMGYEDQVRSFARRLNRPKIQELIENSFCSDLMKRAIQRLVDERIEGLKNAIGK
jgi:hypothetical protein